MGIYLNRYISVLIVHKAACELLLYQERSAVDTQAGEQGMAPSQLESHLSHQFLWADAIITP